jgi:hypothetical protein
MKTDRGNEISDIVDNTLYDLQYESVDKFLSILQEILNSNLTFKTEIKNVEKLDNQIFTQISFINEKGVDSVVDVTIMNKWK